MPYNITEKNAVERGRASGASRTLITVHRRLAAIPSDVPVRQDRLDAVRAELDRLAQQAGAA